MALDVEAMKAKRSELYPSSLSLSYSNTKPLTVLRGYGCYLQSQSGSADPEITTYLDSRNNVPSLGHCHPAIHAAVEHQLDPSSALSCGFAINTNSRYMHPYPMMLCDKLQASMPPPSTSLWAPETVTTVTPPSPLPPPPSGSPWRVFLLNSGSESTDLALRLCETYHRIRRLSLLRAYQGDEVRRSEAGRVALAKARDEEHYVVTFSTSYHGHTDGAIRVSPYKLRKLADPESSMAKEVNVEGNVRWIRAPKLYSPDPSSEVGSAEFHLQAFRELLQTIPLSPSLSSFAREGCPPLCNLTLIYEVGASVGGVLPPPLGYLQSISRLVRSVGGLIVFDEVQSGMGRTGAPGGRLWSHLHPVFGGFDPSSPVDSAAVVPDVLCAGKPLGNGLPLATCICRREVAEAFASTKVEYFNTFGGNPVCAAAGLAVLETLAKEGLVENSRVQGERMLEMLEGVKGRWRNVVGDVRGAGLFIGIELIDPFGSQSTPRSWSIGTSAICSIMKDCYRILTTIDGEDDNVIVFKPPLCWGSLEGEYFCWAFEECIAATVKRGKDGVESIGKTPT